MRKRTTLIRLIAVFAATCATLSARANDPTIAFWIFDEQKGLYPSKVLHDVGPNEYVLVLGRAGYIVDGKFGHALKVAEPRHIDFPEEAVPEKIGLEHYDIPEGRTVEPMNWQNALFAALMTSGEGQMRKEVGFARATATGLNLGDGDFTIEFWYKPVRPVEGSGVVFEIGTGPRGENKKVTRLAAQPGQNRFHFFNSAGNVDLAIPTDPAVFSMDRREWSHLAFVYDHRDRQLSHYVNGRRQALPRKAQIRKLEEGPEDYFALGTSATWGEPLNGKIDELRFSRGRLYTANFTPPGEMAGDYIDNKPRYVYREGPPLLFTPERLKEPVVELGLRKHLFIDDAIVDRSENITFTVNPPRVAEQVLKMSGDDGRHFRKHLNVLEDEEGRIRIYNALVDDYLGVWVSEDGINFEEYPTGIEHGGRRNIVIPVSVGTGTMFIDENAPPEHRWKYITGYHRRGTYVFTSPDGFNFTRHKMALLPFRAATQNDVFYDDQRQKYIGYWRSGFPRTVGGYTRREFTMSISDHVHPPMHFDPVTAEETHEVALTKRLSPVIPWYMDNGPLTPGKFGIEFPTVWGPDDDLDGPSAGVYNPKAEKYAWAPDAYVGFPVLYFHYYEQPEGRRYHIATRGGGPTETQFASSRDGVNWTRYPRPAYAGIGRYKDLDVIQTYLAKGMVKRGEELWQYVFVDGDYHTSAPARTWARRVFRVVQRFDGFVSADSPYHTYGTIVTRPIKLEGTRLVLNINTDAHGYAKVGLLDEEGRPLLGYTTDDAIFINGNHMEVDVEWLGKGSDLSRLQGRNIRVQFKMRGSKLYTMQFKE